MLFLNPFQKNWQKQREWNAAQCIQHLKCGSHFCFLSIRQVIHRFSFVLLYFANIQHLLQPSFAKRWARFEVLNMLLMCYCCFFFIIVSFESFLFGYLFSIRSIQNLSFDQIAKGFLSGVKVWECIHVCVCVCVLRTAHCLHNLHLACFFLLLLSLSLFLFKHACT